ncbi:hypothetical protein I203_104457 [Kwoniella mangroviensis CBS 8507]|uniref:uncharacterized protein n=1 Tax=Kwoniella mangroviensis CBS 8507 TaxID=1296122 RepID=UPI00305727C1
MSLHRRHLDVEPDSEPSSSLDVYDEHPQNLRYETPRTLEVGLAYITIHLLWLSVQCLGLKQHIQCQIRWDDGRPTLPTRWISYSAMYLFHSFHDWGSSYGYVD